MTYILNNAQKAALRRAQAAANNVTPRRLYLERTVQHNPTLVDLVNKLREREELLRTVSTNMLEVARQMENGEQ